MARAKAKLSRRQRKALKLGFAVYRKRDGYQVLRQSDHRSDCLGFFEGIAFRLGFGLPKRILNWSPPDGSCQVAPANSTTGAPQ